MSFRPPVRDDLAALPGYHSPQLDVTHRMNTNESAEPPPAGFEQAVAERVAELDWNRYPDRTATELRNRLAERHGVAPENIFVSNGSNEVLQSIMLAWGGPGRSVVTFEPTYAMHGQISRVTGTGVVEVERGDDFSIDLDSAVDTLIHERPVVTFLCSPNNPTGIVEPPALVAKVLDTVRDFGLLVVDEAYSEFSDWSAIELFDEDRPLIITRTFSKSWAMAAARLGYAIAPAWVVECLRLTALPYNVDAVSQIAGSTALDFEDEMNARIARLVEQRGAIQAGLAELGLDYWPSQSSFVLFRPPEGNADEIWQQLADAGVLIRNCASWPRLEGCLRVTIGTAEENSAFLSALTAILN